MPTIAVVAGVKILMYFDDHGVPHVHAKFSEHEAVIRISDAATLEGSLPKSKIKPVCDWIRSNAGELEATWKKFQS